MMCRGYLPRTDEGRWTQYRGAATGDLIRRRWPRRTDRSIAISHVSLAVLAVSLAPPPGKEVSAGLELVQPMALRVAVQVGKGGIARGRVGHTANGLTSSSFAIDIVDDTD